MEESNIQIKNISKSQVEITAEIPAEDFEKAYKRALDSYNKESRIPGFRPGHIPEHVLREKIGESEILRKASEESIRDWYVQFLKEKKIEAIGPPQVTITKMARNNPLGVKLTTAIFPSIELPDYKVIAEEAMAYPPDDGVVVEDREIDDTLERLKNAKRKSQIAKQQNGDTPKEIELDDEFAKSVGTFNTITELRETVRANLKMDKEMKRKEEKRMAVLDAIAKKTPIEIPDIMIAGEKEKMLEELKSSIADMGMKWEDYLSHIKKTEEDVKKGWDEHAQKRVTYGLLLREIAKKENVDVGEEEMDEYVERVKAQYPAQEREKLDSRRMRQYAYGVIKNEKTFQALELEHSGTN